MKRAIGKWFAVLCGAVLLASCSLLKVSVSTGDPLPHDDVRARVMTRGFYYDLTGDLARAADSIVAAAPDVPAKVRAIRWKIEATRAAVGAAMQSMPEVALADTWILCLRMDAAFAAAPDSLLFGAQSEPARRTVRALALRADSLARDVLTRDRYRLMKEFVTGYVAANPLTGDGTEAPNTTLAWIEYLEAHGVEHAYATGSISEVIADLGDKVDGRTRQLADAVGWSKDILELQLQQDSIRSQLGRQLDSLERNFTRIVVVMEHIPEISDFVASTLNSRVQELIDAMNASVDNAFGQLDRQRDELQHYVSREREALAQDVQQVAHDAIRTALDGLPSLVGRIVGWLILLVVVVLGLPFAAGFWLGRLRERVRLRKKAE